MQKKYINIRVARFKFFITTSIFELTLSSFLSLFQCDLSCCLYILHIPWCPVRVRLNPFWAWFWAFPTGIWAIPCRKKTYTNICVPLLVLFITTSVFWAHFELCLELFPMWFGLLPLHTTYTLMHLDVLNVFVWALFGLSPTGIWAIPCKKWHKYTCSLVEVLHHYIDIWAHFELCLGFFPMWFELLPLHTTYTLVSYTCSFEPILSLVLSFPPSGIWAIPCTKKNIHNKKILNICVPLLAFFITTSVFELALSSVLSFFQCDLSCCLYILHIPWCILMSYMCLFEIMLSLILSFPHKNLSYPIHNKTCINICVPLLVFFITTSVFELTLSSVLSFFQCDLSCCLYILHIPWCILMSYMCLFEIMLSLILSFPHWNLSYPMHKKHT